jgi:hypothetical protein
LQIEAVYRLSTTSVALIAATKRLSIISRRIGCPASIRERSNKLCLPERLRQPGVACI